VASPTGRETRPSAARFASIGVHSRFQTE
jgi:hypothetical protein